MLKSTRKHIKKSLMANVLSRCGVEGTVEAIASAWYSLSDHSVRCVAYEWLKVVAKHLDFDICVIAAMAALSR